MADATVLQEFLAVLGYKVDEASQRRFTDAISSMTKMVEALSLGLAAAAAGVVIAISGLADNASKLQYLAQNLHDSVKNVDAFRFAMRELGLSTQQTDAILTNVYTNIKNNPGARQWLESFAPGKGTIDQLKAFAEAYHNATGESQRVLGQRGIGVLGLSEDALAAFRRAGPGEIDKYFNEAGQKNTAFGLDINKLGQQAVAYEKVWTDLKDTLDRIYESIGQKYIESMTAAFNKVNALLVAHGADIDRIAGQAIEFLVDTINKLVDGLIALVAWWDKLTPAQKEATEAIIALGVAILTPYGKLVLLVAILKELPWDTLKQGFQWLVDKLVELEKATNGVITPFRALEALFASIVVLRVASFFFGIATAARAAATGVSLLVSPLGSIARLLGSIATYLSGGAITTLLTRLGVIAPFVVPTNNTPNSEEESREVERLKREGPQQWVPPEKKQMLLDPIIDWFKSLKLSDLNPFGAAHADELPDNIKKLGQGVIDLNNTLTQHFMDMMADPLGVGTGGGGSGGGIGSGGGGGSGKGVNWNDPRTVEMIKYLMSNGLTMAQAAGVVGNLAAESSLNPGSQGPGGHYGLAQWDQKRQRDFRLEEGVDIHGSSWMQQLHFLLWELNNTEKAAGDKLKSDTDQRTSATDFFKMFERAGDASGPKRADFADNIFGLSQPLLANSPSSYNYNTDSNDKSVNVTQHNTTTIHGSGDPTNTAQSLDDVQKYNNQQLLRQLTSPFQ